MKGKEMELRRYEVGMKLGSGEVVRFFDGSESTPFPEFKKTQKLTPMFLRKLKMWLIVNADKVAERNHDNLLRWDYIGIDAVKTVPQAILDAAELYLVIGGGDGREEKLNRINRLGIVNK